MVKMQDLTGISLGIGLGGYFLFLLIILLRVASLMQARQCRLGWGDEHQSQKNRDWIQARAWDHLSSKWLVTARELYLIKSGVLLRGFVSPQASESKKEGDSLIERKRKFSPQGTSWAIAQENNKSDSSERSRSCTS